MIKKIINLSLFRSASMYTLTTIINSAIPFFLLPIMTRFLTPTDYGIVAMFSVLVGIISPFIGINIHGAVSRKYFDKEEIDFPQYIGNCFIILFASFIVVCLIVLFLLEPISKFSSFPKEWIWAVLVISFAQFVVQIVLVLWQVQVKPIFYGIYQILLTLVNVSLSIWLVVKMQLGWQGRIVAQVTAMSLFAIFGFYILDKQKWLKLSIDTSYMKDALRFGIPLIPHALGGFAMTMTDRIFITNMVGISETGIYTVGYQIGAIVSVLSNAFNQAWVPWLFGKLKQDNPETKIKIVKFTYLYNCSIVLFVIGLSIVFPWFLNFFLGKDFQNSLKYVFWIALGYAFDGMYKMVCNYIFYVQKTYILAWITFFSACLNVGFNYLFISLNGAIGAAQATTLTFFTTFIFTWILSAKVYKMPWGLKMLIAKEFSE